MYFLDDEDSLSGDVRHQKRVLLMQLLFAGTFQATPAAETGASSEISDEDSKTIASIQAALPTIDALIAAHAPERPLTEINQVDLAIMRLIIFESQTESTPKKVLADEAVELAKAFGSETSAKFVNGVLGKILFPAVAAEAAAA